MTYKPVNLIKAAVVLVAFLCIPAHSATPVECCMRGTSQATSFMSGMGVDGDEKFFTVQSAAPNLMFLLDNSGSMYDLVHPAQDVRGSGTGCNNAIYNSVISSGGFSMAGNYPPIDQGVDPGNWNGDSGFSNLFDQTRYYASSAIDPGDCCGGDWTESTATPRTRDNACSLTSNPAACRTCMDTKGYWLDPQNSGSGRRNVFAGKFLNFYPPKFLTARTVLKKLVWNLRKIRLGVTTFDTYNGGSLVTGLNPPCNLALKEDTGDVNDNTVGGWTSNRKSVINKINNIEFGSATPLAEALLNVGQYFTSDSSVFQNWFGSTDWRKSSFDNGSLNSENRSVCFGCQVSSVVIVTDGAPNGDNCVPQCIKKQDPTCVGCDQQDGPCANNSGTSCPSKCGNGSNCASAGNSNCCSSGATVPNYLDGVAKWFHDNDLQTKNPSNGKWSADGKQKLVTYTVGFGIDHPLLTSTANAGGGIPFTANDRATLEDALLSVIADVNKRSTSFGVSSISTLQTSSGISTVLPRFIPGQPGEVWKGYLYRFNVVNELVNGCQPTDPDGSDFDPNDVDQDHYCVSLFYTDTDGDLVEEDGVTGLFLKRGTNLPAKPVWEAGERLKQKAPNSRNIWTVIDSNTDGLVDHNDTVIAFNKANASQLMKYMGIGTDITNDPTCLALRAQMGSATAITSWGQTCAEQIIEWYRGKMAFDPDVGNRDKTRAWPLADIFHSSPIVVEPPVTEEACTFFRGQCLPSLFYVNGVRDATAAAAYKKYVTDTTINVCANGKACEARRRLVLVGSNSGFLHAFDSGLPKSPTQRHPFTNQLIFEDGTGDEVWAFIPPDLLPSLKFNVEKHAYFVDGTPMVRDIWAEDKGLKLGNGIKEYDEFRTIAIVGERSGGQHLFALDLTESAEGASPKPKFLWMWPQPCDALNQLVGQSWSNFHPRPPAIGPVLLDATTTTYNAPFDYTYHSYNTGTSTWVNSTVRAQERWVTLVNGGYDDALVRGRGLAMVDAWSGKTLWHQFNIANPGVNQLNLDYPVTAGIAMLDVGSGDVSDANVQDGYFDTANFGDLGGNFWVARFHEPGKVDTITGLVQNWFLARAFQTQKGDVSMIRRRPISLISANIRQPETGYVRSFFGTGDRANLLDTGGGLCTTDNLMACQYMGCTVSSQYTYTNAPASTIVRGTTWTSSNVSARTNTTAAAAGDTCTNLGVRLVTNVSNCPNTTTGAASLSRDASVTCTQNATSVNCTRTPTANSTTNIAYTTAQQASPPLPLHRFFGIHSFGSTRGGAVKVFKDATTATTFDTARLTESNLTQLENVSVVNPSITAASNGAGWYLEYEGIDERTASPPGISPSTNFQSSCVLWNSLIPSGVSNTVCAGAGSQTARQIQADTITGSDQCAIGFPPATPRSQLRTVLVPPPEPTFVIAVSDSQVSYGLLMAEPGRQPQLTTTAVQGALVEPKYSLELTPQEHVCRHVTGGATCGK